MDRISFDRERELQIVGEYKSLFPGVPGLPKLNTPITPRENLKLLFEGKRPLWMPSSNDYFTLIPRIIPDNVARGFVFDADPLDLKDAGGKDFFGVDWVYVEQVGGSMVRPGNPKIPDINRWEDYIQFPDLEKLDWSGSAERHKEFINTDRMNLIWVMNGLFERLISFMDFENAALAMVDDEQQDGVHRLFSALCDFYDKLFEKYRTYYKADIILFHDDWGSQRAPFFSLNTAREMLVPYLARIVESCHSRGMYLEFHSCGKNELLVPAMIEAGVDAWTPQDMNDRHMLIQKFGDKLIFGVQKQLPMEASEEEIAEAVKSFVDEYGSYQNIIAGVLAMGKNQAVAHKTLYELTRQAYNK
ncbi:MAG: uroporphyrinogen decarboxylase family protein [Eubacteriales bacterium]